MLKYYNTYWYAFGVKNSDIYSYLPKIGTQIILMNWIYKINRVNCINKKITRVIEVIQYM